ncbi:hypothetical protein ACFFRR_004862 [Megaselia abdita]
MTSVQNHETSYESGLKPYKHDNKRERWEHPADFVFACLNSTFGTMHFTGIVFMFFHNRNNYFLGFLYYLLCIVIFAAPIIFIQSFLGQFSSSGYISVFRIAPFFKGLGYLIFAFNFISLTYLAIYVAVPLFYTGASLVSLSDIIECNNSWNTPSCKALDLNDSLFDDESRNVVDWELSDFYYYKNLPSYEYFRYQMSFNSRHYGFEEMKSFSWIIVVCILIVWGLVYSLHCRGMEWIGRVNRFVTLGLMCTLLVFIVKAFFTTGFVTALKSSSESLNHVEALVTGPTLCLEIFGRGWGTILVMGSHNKFRSNIANHSLALILLNMLTTIGSSFVSFVFYGISSKAIYGMSNISYPFESLFVAFPAVLGNLGAPRIFLFMFFFMLTVAEIFGAVIQFSSLITSFFDEHDELRHKRREITIGLVAFFMLTTVLYYTRNGFFITLSLFTVPTHMLLFMLLILVTMWIYGRERFQRDVYFTIGIRFHTALVYMVRFVTPLVCTAFFLIFGFNLFFYLLFGGDFLEFVWTLFVIMLVLFVIPGYMVYAMKKPSGSILTRFRKLNRPTDWYPVDIEEKLKYEEALGSNDSAEPLACDDSF